MASDEFRRALEDAEELQLTFSGRRTGKKFSIPVWFVKDQERLLLLPVNGTASDWYKGVVKNPDVELQASGNRVSATARWTTDRRQVDDALAKFGAKYGTGDTKRYYPDQDALVEVPL